VSCDFLPTPEQKAIVEWNGSAFVTACPGAGKTRVLVERARHLLKARGLRGGIAFLSFTEVAVSELDERLRKEKLLLPPTMPSFVGTFDSFLWRFLITPFGIPGSDVKPRLIPDLDSREVVPYPKARALPLKVFDRVSGVADAKALQRERLTTNDVGQHQAAALRMWTRFRTRGEIDYTDARTIALSRLRSPDTSQALAKALGARFAELIVDEAQDCNPDDLEIINWFRKIGMPVKVICDPHQSIYGFRGGVTNELTAFAETFPKQERLSMTGNFRSSRAIVHAVSCLKRHDGSGPTDEALGRYRNETLPLHLLFYPGSSVPKSVGEYFRALVDQLDAKPEDCPIVAATRTSGARALGIAIADDSEHLACRLAAAVGAFHASFDRGGRKEALEELHKIILRIEGHLPNKSYRQHMVELGDANLTWRPSVLALGQQLRYDPAVYASADMWLAKAQTLLASKLPKGGGRTIAQVLRNDATLKNLLSVPPSHGFSARTIHSVKGAEFPAVCLVISPATAKSTFDFLEVGSPSDAAEELRKVYVGASRAQRLLAIAAPNSQRKRLTKIFTNGATPNMLAIVQL